MKTRVLAILLAGLVLRLEIASFAGHPVDSGLFTFSSRLYYESGHFDTLFPTLPAVYYLQLGFYSLYALIRDLGFPDYVFLNHTNYMVEGIFLRMPAILSDVGIFFLIFRFTNKLRYAAFYFLNPFIIYLTAAWGMYDSLMLFPLVGGFYFLARNGRRLAGLCFAISGLMKLFGFVPLALLALDSLFQRRFKELAIQITTAAALSIAVFIPYLAERLQDFYAGFVLRFLGLSGALSRAYNLYAALSGQRFTGSSPYVWLVAGIVPMLFIMHRKRGSPFLNSMLLWSIVAAVFLEILSQAEPQWLSWSIPISIVYAFLTRREGLARYTYFYGTASAFLSTTLLQTSGYLAIGTPTILFTAFEGFRNSLIVYGISVLALLGMLLGYVFARPIRFRLEIIPVTGLIYLNAYFWFGIMRIVSI